jgi:hypothetical protein
MVTHPGQFLPRDPTGRYLHLKLKRYASKDDLTMPYAIKTWKETPHDAEVDVSPSRRSKCRQCHSTIEKGDLRLRLFLQCHKGCKQSAFFHGSKCAWEYPETRKLESIDEFVGWGELPAKAQTELLDGFRILKDEQKSTQTTKRTDIDHVTDGEPSKPAASSRKRIKKS